MPAPAETAAAPLSGTARVGHLHVAKGITLRTAFWPGAGRKPVGSVLVLQGLAEFFEKYSDVAAALQRRGYDVYSFDWRGQGGSGRRAGHPRLAHVDDFAEYLEDLAGVRAQIWSAAAPPRYVLAHSMGAHVALRALAGDPALAAAAVCSAPMLGVQTGAWPAPLARAVARLAARAGLGRRPVPGGHPHDLRRMRFGANPYTGDAGQFLRTAHLMREHPELVIGGPSIGWLAAAYRSLDALEAPGTLEGIEVPVTLLLAGDERVVRNGATRRLAVRLPSAQLLEIPGARHELLLERPAVLARVWQAIDARLTAAAATP
jgi:lysophospholipase